jgi:hypothetical protein
MQPGRGVIESSQTNASSLGYRQKGWSRFVSAKENSGEVGQPSEFLPQTLAASPNPQSLLYVVSFEAGSEGL